MLAHFSNWALQINVKDSRSQDLTWACIDVDGTMSNGHAISVDGDAIVFLGFVLVFRGFQMSEHYCDKKY